MIIIITPDSPLIIIIGWPAIITHHPEEQLHQDDYVYTSLCPPSLIIMNLNHAMTNLTRAYSIAVPYPGFCRRINELPNKSSSWWEWWSGLSSLDGESTVTWTSRLYSNCRKYSHDILVIGSCMHDYVDWLGCCGQVCHSLTNIYMTWYKWSLYLPRFLSNL